MDEVAEHGFAVNSDTDRFGTDGGFGYRHEWSLIEAAMWEDGVEAGREPGVSIADQKPIAVRWLRPLVPLS